MSFCGYQRYPVGQCNHCCSSATANTVRIRLDHQIASLNPSGQFGRWDFSSGMDSVLQTRIAIEHTPAEFVTTTPHENEGALRVVLEQRRNQKLQHPGN